MFSRAERENVRRSRLPFSLPIDQSRKIQAQFSKPETSLLVQRCRKMRNICPNPKFHSTLRQRTTDAEKTTPTPPCLPACMSNSLTSRSLPPPLNARLLSFLAVAKCPHSFQRGDERGERNNVNNALACFLSTSTSLILNSASIYTRRAS